MTYKFCPDCGKKLVFELAGDDGKVPYCNNCKKFWFDSFSDCVMTMVINEKQELALLHQSYLSKQYTNFVTGYITPGETAEEAAVREVKEEIGVTVEKLDYSGSLWDARGDHLMHAFIGYAHKQILNLSSEVDSARWVPLGDAKQYLYPDFDGNTQQYLYRQYLKKLNRKA